MLIFLTSFVLAAPTKHAYIIAVSEYQNDITPLASDRDSIALFQMLLDIGFSKENIITIGKKEATKKGIISKWEELNQKIQSGDFVHIHYSGHGSQVPDQNGDESEDGLDEVWVTYEAELIDRKLTPSSVLLDDEVEELHKATRAKLGNDGQLFMTTDACHNATATRDIGVVNRYVDVEYPIFDPKSVKVIEKKETYNNSDLAPYIHISASKDKQKAREVTINGNNMGGLTYALTQLLPQAKPSSSYQDIFQDIVIFGQPYMPDQNPTIEGPQNSLLFKNDFVYQEPFYTIKSIVGKEVKIHAGMHLGLVEGAVVEFYPKGTRQPNENPIATGVVIESSEKITKIKVDNLSMKPREKNTYWAFITRKNFVPTGTKAYFKNLTTDQKNELSIYREKIPLVEETTNEKEAAIVLSYAKEQQAWSLLNRLNQAEPERFFKIENLSPVLQNITTRQYLMHLVSQYTQKDKFRVRMLKPDGSPWPLNSEGGYDIQDKDAFRLELENNSSETMNITFLSINDSVGEIEQVFPRKNNHTDSLGVKRGDRLIYPAPEKDPFTLNARFGEVNKDADVYVEKAMIFAAPDEARDFSSLNSKGLEDITFRAKTRGFGQVDDDVPVFGYTDMIMFHVHRSLNTTSREELDQE